MKKKKIFVFLFERFADWKMAFSLSEIRKDVNNEIVTFLTEGKLVGTMGGLQV